MQNFGVFTSRRNRTAAMPFIMLTVLIDMVAIGLIIPVLPALVGTFTGSQADQAFWYGVVAPFGSGMTFGHLFQIVQMSNPTP